MGFQVNIGMVDAHRRGQGIKEGVPEGIFFIQAVPEPPFREGLPEGLKKDLRLRHRIR